MTVNNTSLTIKTAVTFVPLPARCYVSVTMTWFPSALKTIQYRIEPLICIPPNSNVDRLFLVIKSSKLTMSIFLSFRDRPCPSFDPYQTNIFCAFLPRSSTIKAILQSVQRHLQTHPGCQHQVNLIPSNYNQL